MKPWFKVVLSVLALLAAFRFGMLVERAQEAARIAAMPGNPLRLYHGIAHAPEFFTDKPIPE
ncbi:MAG TPA: hypothetical protein VHD36_24190 [Pirellulales bacterium]|nr:hypothetical protein [Pirellulales bacterium]